jgi:dihydrofolate reductase
MSGGMRELVVNTFVSMDGVMQAPGAPDEDPTGGFDLGGWAMPYWDEMMDDAMARFMGVPFDLLLGRGTYEIFASYWPTSDDQPAADQLNNARKFVASTTLKSVEWQNSALLVGDVLSAVAELKRQDGPQIQVHGSAGLLQTLLGTDLIDRIQIMVFPVVIGKGKRLFGTGAVPRSFRVTESRTSSTGVIVATFEPAGPVSPGSME